MGTQCLDQAAFKRPVLEMAVIMLDALVFVLLHKAVVEPAKDVVLVVVALSTVKGYKA